MNDEDDLAVVVEALRQELRAAEDRLTAVEEGFDVIEAGTAAVASADLDQGDQADEDLDTEGEDEQESAVPDLELLMPWVEANVSNWCERLTATNPRATRGIQWCGQWYEHPEAITRLWVVRAAQIEAAKEGTVAVAAYLRDFFDHHLTVLTSIDGPFHNCSVDKHLNEHTGVPRYLPTLSALDTDRPQ